MLNTSRLVFKAVFVLTFTVLSSDLFASMIVGNSILYYQPGDPSRQDVKVKNPDAEPIYIQVSLKEILNPGTPQEVAKPVINPKDAGFLVTPNKLAIQPGGEQLLRFVNLKGLTDSERVFRVALTPVVGDIEAEETGVKILIGYELLVLIQPMAPKILISHVRDGNKLTLENKGNTNVLLHKGTQCKDDKKTECLDLETYRLYAGNKVVIDLKYTTPVNYLLSSGMNSQSVEY